MRAGDVHGHTDIVQLAKHYGLDREGLASWLMLVNQELSLTRNNLLTSCIKIRLALCRCASSTPRHPKKLSRVGVNSMMATPWLRWHVPMTAQILIGFH